jgi:hypothetical protein
MRADGYGLENVKKHGTDMEQKGRGGRWARCKESTKRPRGVKLVVMGNEGGTDGTKEREREKKEGER